MKTLIAIAFLLSGSAYAATNSYDLKIDLTLNGQKTSPHLVLKEGEATRIQKGTEPLNTSMILDVVATKAENGILVNLKVGSIGVDGKMKMAGEHSILTREGVPAKISTISKDKKNSESVEITVEAKKVGM